MAFFVTECPVIQRKFVQVKQSTFKIKADALLNLIFKERKKKIVATKL